MHIQHGYQRRGGIENWKQHECAYCWEPANPLAAQHESGFRHPLVAQHEASGWSKLRSHKSSAWNWNSFPAFSIYGRLPKTFFEASIQSIVSESWGQHRRLRGSVAARKSRQRDYRGFEVFGKAQWCFAIVETISNIIPITLVVLKLVEAINNDVSQTTVGKKRCVPFFR